MKAKLPTFGSYLILYNAEASNYPWRECIKNALTFSEHVYILECNSEDDTYDKIMEEFGDTPNITLKRSGTPWDMDDTLVVGKKKQEAREMVRTDYCIYLDADEILQVKSKEILMDLILHHSSAEVFALPYLTFFGSPYKVGNFENMENFWRWKIFANKPHIGHGPHGPSRKYDESGQMYIDKSMSDGCEIINLETLEIMPSMMYMPPAYAQAGQRYMEGTTDIDEKKSIGLVFSEMVNDFPLICLHYGWVSLEDKARNGIEYWTKTKAYKSGEVEHSRLFDGLNEESKAKKIAEWEEKDTIKLRIKEHPEIMRPRLAMQLKPKILNVALTSSGPFGVPQWGRYLTDALHDYDVQQFAFTDYNTQVPPGATEYQKAESFIQYIKNTQGDKDACVVFGDGFWASTYDGPSKVVSVIHGLWSHPEREKWGDDGLVEQRKQLAEYQLAYFKKAKEMGHTLICVSPFIHKILRDEHGVDSILIPNAVDLDFWDSVRVTNIETDRPLILHGITSKNKGLDILSAVENHPLIKDRFDMGSVDEISEHCQVPKAVAFKAADVAFLPTKWEASSYLLLECLANNLPIAAHRAGILNCKDLHRMDGIGVITDDYDVDVFAQAIVDAYDNRMNYKVGRLFLKENGMTTKEWDESIRKLIYGVL